SFPAFSFVNDKGDRHRPVAGDCTISRGNDGDRSGLWHVRRRGDPPHRARPRTTILLLLAHLHGGLHRPREGDCPPQAPYGPEPGDWTPLVLDWVRPRGWLVARRPRGAREPRLLRPGDARAVRRGMAVLSRNLGRIPEPQREHGRTH